MATPPRDPAEALAFPAELRAALQARQPSALEAFFDAFFEPVRRYVFRAVGENHGEEVTQEAFAHMYAGLTMYDPARDPRPWAFAIAVNQVRAFWRRRARDPVREAEGEAASPDTHAGEGSGPDEALARDEEHGAVRAALAGLGDELREVVQLRTEAGLSYAEIASALGASEVAVRKRYSRALARLRDALDVRGGVS